MIYPPVKNLINIFFALLEKIALATDLQGLKAVLEEIIPYVEERTKVADIFLTDEPTSFQRSIYCCENLILQTLNTVIDWRIAQLKLPPLEGMAAGMSAGQLAQLATPNLLIEESSEIEVVLRMYIHIMVLIMLQNPATESLNDIEVEESISSALTIVNTILRHSEIAGMIEHAGEVNIDKMFYLDMRKKGLVLLRDCNPALFKDHFTGSIANVFVDKLVSLYSQLEVRYRPLEAMYRAQTLKDDRKNIEFRCLSDWLATIGSLLRRLNLVKYPALREKFQVQQREGAKSNLKLSEHMLWDAKTAVAEQLPDYMSYYTKYVYITLTQCRHLLEYLCFTRAGKIDVPSHLPYLLRYKLNSTVHQLRLLQQFTLMMGKCDQKTRSRLESGLAMMMDIASAILYYMHQYSPTLVPLSSFLTAALERFRSLHIADINYVLPLSEVLCDARCLFHSVDISRSLQVCEFDTSLRIHILITAMTTLLDMMPYCHIETLDMPVPVEQQVMVRKMVIEYYLTLLLETRGSQEQEILLNKSTLQTFEYFMERLPHQPIYQFILLIMQQLRCSYMDVADIEDRYFDKLNIEILRQLRDTLHCAIASRLSSGVEMHARLEIFLLSLGGSVASALLRHHAFKNDEVTKKTVELMEDYIKQKALVAGNITAVFIDRLPFHKPIRVLDVKSSFLPPMQTRVRDVPQQTKAGIAVATVVTDSSKVDIAIESDFHQVFLHFGKNVSKVTEFYERALTSKQSKKYASIYGLLGLATCLTYISDASLKNAIYSKLKVQAETILLKAQSRQVWGMCYAEFSAKYESLLVQSGMQKMKSDIEPLKKPKVQEHAPYVRRYYVTATMETFFESVKISKPLRSPSVSKPSITYPFHEMEKTVENLVKNKNLRSMLTALQREVVQQLHVEKFTPLVHGGAVLDALFNIPQRDVDLLCFATKEKLIKFFEVHKQKFHMATFRFLKHSNVMVIKFDAKFVDTVDDELEILLLPDHEHAQHLLTLAREFGINLVFYYDPINNKFLDPLRQLRNITDLQLVDVSTLLAIDLVKYFAEYPERMLDMLYKLAKYNHNGIALKVSDTVCEAFAANTKSLTRHFKAKISLSKFDKLFMLGFAHQSWIVLSDPRFHCISSLFPNLCLQFQTDLEAACRTLDSEITSQENTALTIYHRELLRAKFICNILYRSFIHNYDINQLMQDKDSFDIACVKFITQSNFYVTNELINLIQANWWQQLNKKALLTFSK